jgi:hypothetical protein
LLINQTIDGEDNRGSCYNGTKWLEIYLDSAGAEIWEEAMIWDITNTSLFHAEYNFTKAGVYPYKWISYGNGTSKNLNVSNTRSYTVNSSDTCTCAGPTTNWFINCFDNCTLNSNCNMNLHNVTINGTTGHFFIVANLSNIDLMYWGDGCTLIKGATATIS